MGGGRFEEGELVNQFIKGTIYYFTLILDGDYLDIYFNDTKRTLVAVDDNMQEQYSKLIKNNTCDISNITWPRRANGTMDYPPPTGMSNYKTTHHTTDILRLRDEPNTSSLMVTTLSNGSAVQVLETGEM